VSFPGWHVEAAIVPPSSALANSDSFSACLDLERAGKQLTVRRRLPGDRFQPLGVPQPKKLNVFMIDEHIPRAWRRHIPVVCNEKQVLWLVGYRIDERVKVTPATKKLLRLTFKRA
jgi:tRNA(Ile)-lysidine synthase